MNPPLRPSGAKGEDMRKIEYRVEQETGVGWGGAKPYPVFTTSEIVGTIRTARKMARLLRRAHPLFQVRIVRDERRETVVGLKRKNDSARSARKERR